MTPSFEEKKNGKTFIFCVINKKNAEGFITSIHWYKNKNKRILW